MPTVMAVGPFDLEFYHKNLLLVWVRFNISVEVDGVK